MDPIASSRVAADTPMPSRVLRPEGEAGRIRETAQEFEGVFIGMLLKAMRTSVGSGGLFKNGMDTQTYRDMFDQEVGRQIAKGGGIGLAQLILRDQALRPASTRPKACTPCAWKEPTGLVKAPKLRRHWRIKD